MKKGYTLIELLIVIAVFAVIATVSAQTIILTLQSTRKADTISKVRENVDYAFGEMSRMLYNASSVPNCNNAANSSIAFLDQSGNQVTFSCTNIGGNPSAIASSSAFVNANLTSTDLNITSCSFTCAQSSGSAPPYVVIKVTASDTNGKNLVSDETQVTLRTY